MSWITLSEADLLTGITGPELNAARTAALKSGQTDPVPVEIAQVTREVRGRIAACSNNTLGAAGTIADECKTAAIDVCVYRLCKRVPGAALLTKQREDAHKLALDFLAAVAACRVVLEQPTTATTENVSAPPSPRFSGRDRTFTRSKQEGL